jgi:hypothetical protein
LRHLAQADAPAAAVFRDELDGASALVVGGDARHGWPRFGCLLDLFKRQAFSRDARPDSRSVAVTSCGEFFARHWQDIVGTYTSLADSRGKRTMQQKQEFELPRLSEAENLERAIGMVERLHRLYVRTLKALQDQRSVPRVTVRRAGQVNVAHQQVNVSGRGGPAGRAG